MPEQLGFQLLREDGTPQFLAGRSPPRLIKAGTLAIDQRLNNSDFSYTYSAAVQFPDATKPPPIVALGPTTHPVNLWLSRYRANNADPLGWQFRVRHWQNASTSVQYWVFQDTPLETESSGDYMGLAIYGADGKRQFYTGADYPARVQAVHQFDPYPYPATIALGSGSWAVAQMQMCEWMTRSYLGVFYVLGQYYHQHEVQASYTTAHLSGNNVSFSNLKERWRYSSSYEFGYAHKDWAVTLDTACLQIIDVTGLPTTY